MQPRTVISDVQLECAVFTCTVCKVDRKPRIVISDAQPECQVHLHHVADTSSCSVFHCESLCRDPNQALILLSFSLPYNYSHDVFPEHLEKLGLAYI